MALRGRGRVPWSYSGLRCAQGNCQTYRNLCIEQVDEGQYSHCTQQFAGTSRERRPSEMPCQPALHFLEHPLGGTLHGAGISGTGSSAANTHSPTKSWCPSLAISGARWRVWHHGSQGPLSKRSGTPLFGEIAGKTHSCKTTPNPCSSQPESILVKRVTERGQEKL